MNFVCIKWSNYKEIAHSMRESINCTINYAISILKDTKSNEGNSINNIIWD